MPAKNNTITICFSESHKVDTFVTELGTKGLPTPEGYKPFGKSTTFATYPSLYITNIDMDHPETGQVTLTFNSSTRALMRAFGFEYTGDNSLREIAQSETTRITDLGNEIKPFFQTLKELMDTHKGTFLGA